MLFIDYIVVLPYRLNFERPEASANTTRRSLENLIELRQESLDYILKVKSLQVHHWILQNKCHDVGKPLKRFASSSQGQLFWLELISQYLGSKVEEHDYVGVPKSLQKNNCYGTYVLP